MDAFSKEERMPFVLMLAMSCLWNTEFLAFYDETTLCGLIYMATLGKQTFIMFFAVPAKLRSKGYGSLILEQVQALHSKNMIIVSIEPLDEDAKDYSLRCRRKQFYQRNGYEETGYFMKLSGQIQEILIRNGVFQKKKFILFFMLYSNLAVMPKVWRDKDV